MNIQLALDRMTIEEGIAAAEAARPHVEWMEVGTSLIKEFGMESVRRLRAAFPEKVIVADVKTFDNAKYEFELCYAAGADVATVMGAAPLVSIEACMQVAEKHGKRVMIDLLNVPDAQMAELAKYRDAIFCLHVSKDQQERSGAGQGFGAAVPAALAGQGLSFAVAGGITRETLPGVMQLEPDVVVVGSAITQAADPAAAARELRGGNE